jgi:hypothetical protein
VKRTWAVYREVEHLSLPYALWCQTCYAYHACMKRVYVGKYIKKASQLLDYLYDSIQLLPHTHRI